MLENKVAIVTGAAHGIGYAVAKRFVLEGAKVLLADINDEAGETALTDLKSLGEVAYVHCNVAERLDVRNLVAEALNAFGDIDILVNNAAIMEGGNFLELDEDDFERVMRVNLKGTFLCSQAVGRYMVEKVDDGGTPGTIINMSSINAVLGLPDQIPYCVSKAGVTQLTRTVAIALADKGIRVNAIGPGTVQTEMQSGLNLDLEGRQRVLARTPMGRFGDPAEIAGIAAFLASEDASYITGQVIYADGGRLPLNYTVPSN